MKNIEYPPCSKCGCEHGMGLEDNQSGDITPLDLCRNCLWADFKYDDLPVERVTLYEEITVEQMRKTLKDTLKKIMS